MSKKDINTIKTEIEVFCIVLARHGKNQILKHRKCVDGLLALKTLMAKQSDEVLESILTGKPDERDLMALLVSEELKNSAACFSVFDAAGMKIIIDCDDKALADAVKAKIDTL